MFCPICKSEYREGFTLCDECNVKLVEELPEETIPREEGLIEIAASLQKSDIAIIKSLLDAENIDYIFLHEALGSLYPIPETNKLLIPEKDQNRVKSILKDFL